MTQYQQFLGSPDIFEKATGQRITEEQAKTAGLFTPAGLSPQVELIKTPRPDVKVETDFIKMAGTSLPISLISEPAPAPKEGITVPESPKPEAPQITDSYFTSITKDLENKTAALQAEYDKQIKSAQDKQTEVQKQIEAYQTEQKKTIEDEVQPLLTPFREQKEQAERERLKVEENYFANQTLTGELGTLLTEGNDLIKQQKETTGLAVIRNPRIAQTISDVSARIGVIQAVMSARSGQIAEAYKLIDRSVNAITADNQDQLKYYETLYNFYTSQKDEEGKKLVSLTTTEKDYLDKKIDSLKSDLTTAQANAKTIKNAMADPDTAFAYAQAGVTLNDNIGEINRKLAVYAYSKEIRDTSVKMAEKGFSYLAPGQTAPAGSEIYTLIDTEGKIKKWYKDKPKAKKIEKEEKDAAYNEIKQKAVKLFKDGMSANEYRQVQQELTDMKLGSYLDDFDEWISNMNYLTPETQKEVGISGKVEPTIQSTMDTLKKTLQQYNDAGYSREDAESQYKAENKLENIPEAIKKIFNEVFGENKSWWKFWE